MSQPNSGSTKPPDYAKLMKLGYDLNLKYAPKLTQADLDLRNKFDRQLWEQQAGLQETEDPRLAQMQFDALQRRDPQWVALHQGLGDKVNEALTRGYVDPRQEAAYQQWSQMAGKGEPQREAAYGALGKQVTGDTLRGSTASPAMMRDMTQAILSRSPGLSYGEAQDMAAAVYTGQRGQALQQQRQAATGQFLQQATPTGQRQASLAQFYGAQSPEMQAMGLAGTFIQPSNSIVGAENMIGGVQAPRALGYLNPNAGANSAQFGLQNFQNQLASNQLSGGGSNPWASALGTVGGIAGTAVGSAYGGAAGGAIGGYTGSAVGNYAGGLFG